MREGSGSRQVEDAKNGDSIGAVNVEQSTHSYIKKEEPQCECPVALTFLRPARPQARQNLGPSRAPPPARPQARQNLGPSRAPPLPAPRRGKTSAPAGHRPCPPPGEAKPRPQTGTAPCSPPGEAKPRPQTGTAPGRGKKKAPKPRSRGFFVSREAYFLASARFFSWKRRTISS